LNDIFSSRSDRALMSVLVFPQAKKEGLLDVKLQMGLDSTGKDPFLALASPFLTVVCMLINRELMEPLP
jgi:hypothetical protein